ncbi:hypothetical protein ACM01_15685 [Streptomyces viridochromogenes]|uniref:Uncharacterized protein n=1 Tax=Streptomyces viridochromogenes TaxID=1938 RepID=A0A0J7ZFX9_STRVR|nr:hypothetical protein ACM01_15685 [Streptomyces viridochromogenes]
MTEDRNASALDFSVLGALVVVASGVTEDRNDKSEAHTIFGRVVAVVLRGDRGSRLVVLGQRMLTRPVWRSPFSATADCNNNEVPCDREKS